MFKTCEVLPLSKNLKRNSKIKNLWKRSRNFLLIDLQRIKTKTERTVTEITWQKWTFNGLFHKYDNGIKKATGKGKLWLGGNSTVEFRDFFAISSIIWNDTRPGPISWELNIENTLFSICVSVRVGGHPSTNFLNPNSQGIGSNFLYPQIQHPSLNQQFWEMKKHPHKKVIPILIAGIQPNNDSFYNMFYQIYRFYSR